MTSPFRVLLLSARPELAEALQTAGFEVVRCASVTEARERLREDFHLLSFDGLEPLGEMGGFSDQPLAQTLAEERRSHLLEVQKKNEDLARANAELEAFSYSVSHDLRAPLRAINGFSQALHEDCGHLLDQDGREHLERILSATSRMNELIDDLLTLSRVSRHELRCVDVDITSLATSVAKDLIDARAQAENPVTFAVHPDLAAKGDPSLLRAILENLIGNAFKFTSKRAGASIEVGAVDRPDGTRAFFVRDNGVGFDMKRVEKLFRPFQRLHTQQEFEGTGIGLATVQRIVARHGGRAWAEASDAGACIWFTVAT